MPVKINTVYADIEKQWYDVWKPQVLQHPTMSKELTAEILGISTTSLRERLSVNAYPFAEKMEGQGRNCYDIYSLRFIKWYEGRDLLDYDLIGQRVFDRVLAYAVNSMKRNSLDLPLRRE